MEIIMKRLTFVGLALLPSLAFAGIQSDLENAILAAQDLNPHSTKVSYNIVPPNPDQCTEDSATGEKHCPVAIDSLGYIDAFIYKDVGRYTIKLVNPMADSYTITPAGRTGQSFSEMHLSFNLSTVNKTPISFDLECKNSHGYSDECGGSVLVSGQLAFSLQDNARSNMTAALSSVAQAVSKVGEDTYQDAQSGWQTYTDSRVSDIQQEIATSATNVETSVDSKLQTQKSEILGQISSGDAANSVAINNAKQSIANLSNTVNQNKTNTDTAIQNVNNTLANKADVTYVNDEIAKVSKPGVENCYDPGYRLTIKAGVLGCERDPSAASAIVRFNGGTCPNVNDECTILGSSYNVEKVVRAFTKNGAASYKVIFNKEMTNNNYIVNLTSSWSPTHFGLFAFERINEEGWGSDEEQRATTHVVFWTTTWQNLAAKYSQESESISVSVFNP